MSDAVSTSGLSPSPGLPKDRPGRPMPQNIAHLLAIVRVLIGYGLHLAETLEHRAAARGFATIARFFGTARTATIHARLCRGLLRAMALERVLLARAARGRDLVAYKPRQPAPHAARPADARAADTLVAQAAHTLAAPPPAAPHPGRRPDPDEAPDPAKLPTLEQLEAEIRRRPIGRALADVCGDLGISPSLCQGNFWFEITCGLMWYRGNLPRLMKAFRRREVHFCDTEADRNPALGWPEPTRDGIRRVMGFFIGEPPVPPFPWPVPPARPESLPGQQVLPNRPDAGVGRCRDPLPRPALPG